MGSVTVSSRLSSPFTHEHEAGSETAGGMGRGGGKGERCLWPPKAGENLIGV